VEGKVKITGNFEIWVGDKKIAEGKNRFTRYLMSSIVAIIANTNYSQRVYTGLDISLGLAYKATARVGRDTTTSTTTDMTDLVDKINKAPSSVTRKLWRLETEWKYMAEFLFKWNAEVLPNTTIGEFGVWLFLDNDDWSSPLTNPRRFGIYGTAGQDSGNRYLHCVKGGDSIKWNIDASIPPNRLASRIASADGKFTEFDYDNTEPLTYIWRLIVQIK